MKASLYLVLIQVLSKFESINWVAAANPYKLDILKSIILHSELEMTKCEKEKWITHVHIDYQSR